MATLKQLSEDISHIISARAKRIRRASFFVKAVLIGLGTAIVSMAQFLGADRSEPPNPWQVTGIVCSVVVLVGVLFLVFTEEDPTKELAKAREAIEAGREAESYAERYEDIEDAANRAAELYTAYGLMRGVAERIALGKHSDELAGIRVLLTAVSRHLHIGMGFSTADQWTLSVYRAEDRPSGTILALVGSARAIPCEIDKAREWPIGVGPGGVAFANRSEVIVPDMRADGLGNIYTAPGINVEHDDHRYQSMVAIPIIVGKAEAPWGVAVASSSKPYHFNHYSEPGLQPAEGARALAGMVALIVALYSDSTRLSEGEEDDRDRGNSGSGVTGG